MLRIAICDDDKILVTQIEEMLNRYLDKKMIDRYIEIFYDGASLERIYEKGDRFDIIYLDIEMSGKNGIEAAKSIRRLDRDVLLIYVSSYETYFMQLFEVEPFRFIKKPIKETEFEEVIDFAYERIIEEDAYFEYKYNKTVGKVLIRKIMYFESAGRIVNIHTEESTYRYYGKLDEVERRLVQNKIPFLRIHKSFYVNFHFVDKITFSKLILSDGTVLQISQDRQNIIRKRYLDILGGKVRIRHGDFKMIFDIRCKTQAPLLVILEGCEIRDKLHVLNMKADDYIEKPINIDELEEKMLQLLHKLS